ncbi:unnamed protein product [Acanthoscelides obtectus]|uniref:PiggyBac transposable element-derived protein domain-containing protein n=1 Tax=Acanthoscelides obtectus TaxID=200917 RepID=A0A9P0NWN3_ACAOB|nr:unnamed protein product [Acanthoscelides obtectus]CAK1642926.1 PiggyBac transposable element-derived protein 4 [Acanthoscelides obtectus]
MASLCYPGQQLSLDEFMVLWRGRLVFRQYIKNKRHKYDIKLYILTEPNRIIGHSIYLDNFYNSFELANKLTSRNTYCTGTLSSKRTNNPKELVARKLKKGESAAVYSNNIMICKRNDKREVLYISNEHQNNMVEVVDRRNRTKQKPLPILQYNKYMGGVDDQDQVNSYYPCDRKTLRWYKKLGIHFIQLMLLNSYFF